MCSSLEKVLTNYYESQLKFQRETALYKAKYDILSRQLQVLKEKEQRGIHQNEVFKGYINDSLSHKNVLKEQIKAKYNEIENLKKNINDLKKCLNSKSVLFSGPLYKDNTANIWDAAAKGSLPAVKFYFAENSANIYKKDENSFKLTPLHYASEKGYLEIVEYLILNGVEIDAVSTNDETSLQKASCEGHASIVKFLLDNGANINHLNKEKESALHFAVHSNKLAIVKILIERGANRKIKNKYFKTPLALAQHLNNTAIVDYLNSLQNHCNI